MFYATGAGFRAVFFSPLTRAFGESCLLSGETGEIIADKEAGNCRLNNVGA